MSDMDNVSTLSQQGTQSRQNPTKAVPASEFFTPSILEKLTHIQIADEALRHAFAQETEHSNPNSSKMTIKIIEPVYVDLQVCLEFLEARLQTHRGIGSQNQEIAIPLYDMRSSMLELYELSLACLRFNK